MPIVIINIFITLVTAIGVAPIVLLYAADSWAKMAEQLPEITEVSDPQRFLIPALMG